MSLLDSLIRKADDERMQSAVEYIDQQFARANTLVQLAQSRKQRGTSLKLVKKIESVASEIVKSAGDELRYVYRQKSDK